MGDWSGEPVSEEEWTQVLALHLMKAENARKELMKLENARKKKDWVREDFDEWSELTKERDGYRADMEAEQRQRDLYDY